MIVIWGYRRHLLVIGKGTFLCPKCTVPRPFLHKRWKRFFTLYFIPLIPLGNGAEFVECTVCGTAYRPEILKAGGGVQDYEARHPIERALAVIALVLIALVGVLALQQVVSGGQAGQAAAQAAAKATSVAATFGANNLSRCNNLVQSGNGRLSNASRVVVVNPTTGQVWDDYQSAVPAANQAASSADLTDIICIQTWNTVYNEDTYGEQNSSTIVYRCTRYIEQTGAYIIDAHTGQPTAYKVYTGGPPPDCPEQTDRDLSEYGSPPTPATVIVGLFSAGSGAGQIE